MKAIDEPRMLATSVHRATGGATGGAATPALSMRRSYGRAQEGRRAAAVGPPAALRKELGGSRGRLHAELDGDVLRRPVAADGDGHLLAGLRGRDVGGEVVGGADRIAVEARDHVTDLQAGLRGRRAGDDLRDPGAAR